MKLFKDLKCQEEKGIDLESFLFDGYAESFNHDVINTLCTFIPEKHERAKVYVKYQGHGYIEITKEKFIDWHREKKSYKIDTKTGKSSVIHPEKEK